MPGREAQVVVIGGGITGLATAYRLAQRYRGAIHITVLEADDRLGGKIKTSPFAGLPSVDEGPDAYLARVPHAVTLAHDLGLDSSITHPASGHAAIHHDGLCPLPEGLLLGVPTGLARLARSPLLSWRGKARAALEPFLPPSPDPHDSIGLFVRQRFGIEVHERLVDPLVGSIYAADTMNFSLAMVPQLAALSNDRSILLAARRNLRSAPPPSRPVFDTPRGGMGMLVGSLADALGTLGVHIRTGTSAVRLERDRSPANSQPRYRVSVHGAEGDDEIQADAVIVTSPARASADLVSSVDAAAGTMLRTWDHASVVMVTLRSVEKTPSAFRGLSGYLIPKPEQDRLTAVSFGSNKWEHWRPADDSMIVRASLGRDGAPIDDLIDAWSDEQFVEQVVNEVACHTGVTITPAEQRVTRWPCSFPQYRPGHAKLVESLDRSLEAAAPGVLMAGASFRGIGVPACVAQAERAAEVTARFLNGVL